MAAVAAVSAFAVDFKPQWDQDPLGGFQDAAQEIAAAKFAPPPAEIPAFSKIDTIFPELVAKIKPSVVKVRTETGGGTGFIVDSRGYLITNAHVVKNFSKFEIKLNDHASVPGVLVAVQPARDLALIQIESKRVDWPALEISERDPQEGETVATMGYPWGLPFSVSLGIVSGISRQKPQEGNAFGCASTYIQIDAAINTGNSGGPLVDMNGRVVGVNAVLISAVREFHGIAYAITPGDVKAFLEAFLPHNRMP
ncbi:MAG: hypothetical protein A2X37_08165 [Elusimicrobia bacterium GWA2_66_18]|nr:MAG: hypothetical protein A2X37_08165 [Elusimicrobia bacterium GWA2_66_18]